MNSAEFDTRRRLLGLSVEEAAELGGVRERTVNRWISGQQPIPDDVEGLLDKLQAQMTQSVAAVVAQATEMMASGPVTLWRYPNRDIQRTSPHAGAMLPGPHAMLIAWTAHALHGEGFDVDIDWAY